jgi:hypothetical protein
MQRGEVVMPSPFPGMDPYVERPAIFRGGDIADASG